MLAALFASKTASTKISTLSLHDALPISITRVESSGPPLVVTAMVSKIWNEPVTLVTSTNTITGRDRKSTRLNSSHVEISYAVFCLKKNNKYKLNRIMERKH